MNSRSLMINVLRRCQSTAAHTPVAAVNVAAAAAAKVAPLEVGPKEATHRLSAQRSGQAGSGFVVTSPHHRVTKNLASDYSLSHATYTNEEVSAVRNDIHYEPKGIRDRAALAVLKVIRVTFDTATAYGTNMSADKYMFRGIILETVAGVPGMVGAMWRHFGSLRTMQRDNGWIHTLLEEAENERMHLLTFLEVRKPTFAMRATVLLGQGVVTNLYTLAYLLSPSACHRFVGFLEEEAVHTYTKWIQDIDEKKMDLAEFGARPAPAIGIKYWRLPEGSQTMRDLLLAIRADESIHRDVNHTLADLKPTDPNPFL